MTETPIDTVPVLLARIEGTLGNVLEKVSSLIVRVDRTEMHMGQIQLDVQRLDLEAKASAATVTATAKALREAKEAQDATSRAETVKADRAWSPVTKVFAFTAFLATAFGIISLFVQ